MAIPVRSAASTAARSRSTRLAVATLAAAGLVALPTTAGAAVRITAPATVEAGASYAVRWSATPAPRGATTYVTVRRDGGTTTRLRRVRGVRGALRVRRAGIGERTYGIVTVRRGRALARDRARTAVYGEVPFTTLFHSDTLPAALPGGPFDYLPSSFHDGDDDDLGRYPRQINTITVTGARNRCRSARIRFAGFNQYEAPRSTTILTLTQPGRPTQRATAAYETVGTLEATLVPGLPWVITGGATGPSGVQIEFNGSAVCSSARPAASAYQQPGS